MSWSLSTKPSRWEIALAVSIGAEALFNLAADDKISWLWFIGGSAAFGLATGPGAASDSGQRIGTWFKSIGVAGRLTTIIAFAAVIGTITVIFAFVRTPLYSFATGGLLTLAALIFLKLLVSFFDTTAQSQ